MRVKYILLWKEKSCCGRGEQISPSYMSGGGGPGAGPTASSSQSYHTYSAPMNCHLHRRRQLHLDDQQPRPSIETTTGTLLYTRRHPALLISCFRRDDTMLRQTLARSAWRNGRRTTVNAVRAFSATTQRPAEVELTIGAWQRPRGEPIVRRRTLTLFKMERRSQ